MTEPLHLAVVGHTNTGKTSLLRTLARDVAFGEVSPRASTTRHVEGVRLLADGTPVVELFDTPGMEDPIGLLDLLDLLAPPTLRLDGPARIERFLASPESGQHFEQEAKVLRQLLASDAALVVIDARDPVLAKYRDELAILAACGKPLLPVLNFVSDPANREEAWREALARLGLHAVIRFDTVLPEIDGERLLFEKLATLIDSHRAAMQGLIETRAREVGERRAAARQLIAELLLDVAAMRLMTDADDETALNTSITAMQHRVRQHEQACVEDLLALYRFRPGDVRTDALPFSEGRWEGDLFDAGTLRAMGVRVGKGMVAGALTGLGIDLVVGGMTMGAAALAGAVAGGLWQTVSHYGGRILGKLRGHRTLAVDDAILRLLALRQRWLLDALERRGHAAIHPIELKDPDTRRWRSGALHRTLEQARHHPEWSALNPEFQPQRARAQAIEQLADEALGQGG